MRMIMIVDDCPFPPILHTSHKTMLWQRDFDIFGIMKSLIGVPAVRTSTTNTLPFARTNSPSLTWCCFHCVLCSLCRVSSQSSNLSVSVPLSVGIEHPINQLHSLVHIFPVFFNVGYDLLAKCFPHHTLVGGTSGFCSRSLGHEVCSRNAVVATRPPPTPTFQVLKTLQTILLHLPLLFSTLLLWREEGLFMGPLCFLIWFNGIFLVSFRFHLCLGNFCVLDLFLGGVLPPREFLVVLRQGWQWSPVTTPITFPAHVLGGWPSWAILFCVLVVPRSNFLSAGDTICSPPQAGC